MRKRERMAKNVLLQLQGGLPIRHKATGIRSTLHEFLGERTGRARAAWRNWVSETIFLSDWEQLDGSPVNAWPRKGGR